MFPRPALLLPLLVLLVLPAPAARADARADAWIAKVRAATGTEAALKAVQSIRFIGVLDTVDRVEAKDQPGHSLEQPIHLGIDIVFQKPCLHRVILRSDKRTKVTGLDDYDAWERIAENDGEQRWQLQLLDARQIRHLRANTLENLAFYRGLERLGGRVDFLGETDLNGRPCVKLAFIHSDEISFTRYLDRETGRVLLTVTESGTELREEGEQIVAGVRFPLRLISKDASGRIVTLTFSEVRVNELLPPGEFAIPALRR